MTMRLALSLLWSWHGSAVIVGQQPSDVQFEMEPEVSMQALQRFAITAVFTLTCFTVPVQAADRLVTKETEKAPAAVRGSTVKAVKQDASGATRRLDEKVKNLEQRYSTERDLLIVKVKDLLRRQKDSTKEEQENVRQQYRKVIDQIKELRKEQLDELRQQHPEHQQLIDAAREATKEEVKEKVRERRGHGE